MGYKKNIDYPNIEFFPGGVTMSGSSIPQDAFLFYDPFIRQIKEIASRKEDFTFNFKMDYYNTASSMYMSKILKILKSLSEHAKVVINWYYLPSDEDIFELGFEYKETLEMDINLIEVN